MRQIKIFSTKNQKSDVINSDATTWGQLREEIKRNTTALNEDMVASVFETRNSLISSEAALPEGGFTVVLTPAKTKSGAIDTASVMASLRDKINEAFSEIIDEIENGEFGQQDSTSSSVTDELKNFKLD